ncbi:hypothetical protein [Vibrio sp. MA40-2]|uniref:hypothetical protein n=1 Tax=Vibrio sp. MA40-2 TaxID=3391828 RepID=UPI0039A766A2
MAISSLNSGVELLKTSDLLTQKAASEIADVSEPTDLQFNKIDSLNENKNLIPQKPSMEQSIISLQQANSYNKAGAKVIQVSDEIIGTLLDTHI